MPADNEIQPQNNVLVETYLRFQVIGGAAVGILSCNDILKDGPTIGRILSAIGGAAVVSGSRHLMDIIRN